MMETDSRYTHIEKEALATTWTCERFSTYILGRKFAIETHHKTLVPLLGSKHLDSLPPRILRFRLSLTRFDYTITHVPGKLLHTADTLSRAPSAVKDNDAELQKDAETFVKIGVVNLPVTKGTLMQYQKAQDEDRLCCLIRKHCKEGWPQKRNLENQLIPFWNARGNLTTDQNRLLLYGSRIMVPKSLRRETLSKIHNGHQGIQRCRLWANISVCWPGISMRSKTWSNNAPPVLDNSLPGKSQLSYHSTLGKKWEPTASTSMEPTTWSWLTILQDTPRSRNSIVQPLQWLLIH